MELPHGHRRLENRPAPWCSPANLVPASAWALTEIISRQGLPSGTFNLVMGSGADVGEALIQSAEIDALTFTGSRRRADA
jgi:acyl-CoA reductase-like NAD-dependent aldehyde dehydrogenase